MPDLFTVENFLLGLAWLSVKETSELTNISTATVKRDWAMGKAWLAREMGKQPSRNTSAGRPVVLDTALLPLAPCGQNLKRIEKAWFLVS